MCKHSLNNTNACYLLLGGEAGFSFKSEAKYELIGSGKIVLSNNENRKYFSCQNVHEIPIRQSLMHELIVFLSTKKLKLVNGKKVSDYYLANFDVHDVFFKTVELSQAQSEQQESKFITHVLMLLSYFFEQPQLLSYLLRAVRHVTCLQVEAIIESCPSRNWKLNDIANELCMSASGLKRRLREEGTCYKKNLVKSRLRLAKVLLESKNTSILDVANKCGFSSTSYFISVFKKHYLITPSCYSKGIYCCV